MWSATKKYKVDGVILFLPSETCFMVSCCDHISKSLSWFTAGSLRCEIISQSCHNISLLLLWGHYGLTPKSSLSNSEGLIYLLPVQILLHLFWHDQELLNQATDTVTLQPRHCHPCSCDYCSGWTRSWGWSQVPGVQHNHSSDAQILGPERFGFSSYTLDHEDCFSEK